MSDANAPIHIYHRVVDGGGSDSLSVIAGLIEPGQTLLDLGMGTGALGHYLSQRHAIVADGVTLSSQEAEIARNWYRQALVADLERDPLATLFGDHRYDCIVCADVLEHLKAPQNLLAQCKTLLKPGGRLITSVPNAGYCGLVAELMQGDFRYRPEGLLDNTHLRFFTRASLQRFFDENGWATQSISTIQRDLSASEFKVAFDSLPPAVARYLLAVPDALSYQFISELQPVDSTIRPSHAASSERGVPTKVSEPVNALFSAALYLAVQNQYDEATKLVTAGRIGDQRQTLSFDIPASPQPYTGVRLDPADRPGFFRLHHLHIWLPNGEPAWQWQAGKDLLTPLAKAPHNHMLFPSLLEVATGALLVLHGDDPWIELPLAPGVLQTITKNGARLEVCAGWPMSADYLEASTTINTLQVAHQQTTALLLQEIQRLSRQLAQAESQPLIAALNSAPREPDAVSGQFQQPAMPQTGPATTPLPTPRNPVDIIVPVYRSLEDTRCCLESVLAAPCHTAWRLIVINDCSPEPEIADWLRVFAQRDPRISLLENSENLGFVSSVNRGMALSQENDVVLLNSDTEVANDWLDRIQRAAYSAPQVASVTPFSNNATICSYPRFCQANQLPSGYDSASLDRLFARHLVGQTLEIPTGVGFCMYLRRQCLQEVGLFDVANFGKGYGEENDFCVRARQAGWTHLHALDIFVRHAGGGSFGDSKSERELQAMATLRRLHPRYEDDVHAYVQRDPAQAARLKIDIARIAARGRPVILAVSHNREGGTLRHIQELARQLSHQATFLRLVPSPGGAELLLEEPREAFAHQFSLPHERPRLLQTLRLLQVGHIHYHHLLGHAPDICDLPAELGVSHDFTAHDYYSYCPQISLTDHQDRYCGEEGIEQCHGCLQRRPAPDGESIESWRSRHARLLSRARHVIAPSFDAAQRLQRFVPTTHIQVVPHASLYPRAEPHPTPRPRVLADGQRLRIVVLGALSRIKGADTLEEVATVSAIHNLDLEFHLIGYPYRSLRVLPRNLLTVHDGYQEEDLPQLIQSLQADAVWFPALWPETYSYTLSASLKAGLPIIAPDLGAFAERLQNREWTWLCAWYQSPSQWLEFFKNIRQEHFCSGVGPSPTPAFTPPSLYGADAGSPALVYRSNYLEHLPRSDATKERELTELDPPVGPAPQHPPAAPQRSAAIKRATLMRLRASPALSALGKLVPMRLQQRVKSWLIK